MKFNRWIDAVDIWYQLALSLLFVAFLATFSNLILSLVFMALFLNVSTTLNTYLIQYVIVTLLLLLLLLIIINHWNLIGITNFVLIFHKHTLFSKMIGLYRSTNAIKLASQSIMNVAIQNYLFTSNLIVLTFESLHTTRTLTVHHNRIQH